MAETALASSASTRSTADIFPESEASEAGQLSCQGFQGGVRQGTLEGAVIHPESVVTQRDLQGDPLVPLGQVPWISLDST